MLSEAQDVVTKAVLVAFRQQFFPQGQILVVSESRHPGFVSDASLVELGVTLHKRDDLPTVVIHSPKRSCLVLIDVAKLRGAMSARRREILTEMFSGCKVRLVFVTAFMNRTEFSDLLAEPAWETVAWFAEEPNHLVHFDGRRLSGARRVT